jgi:hypothetical protein
MLTAGSLMASGDELFVKVLLHNKLITSAAMQQAQQLHVKVKDLISLPEFLVSKNYITEDVHKAVTDAIGKRQSSKQPGGDKSESGRREAIIERRRWQPRSQRMAKVVAEAEAGHKSGTHKAIDRMEDVDRFVRHIVPTRTYAEVLQRIIEHDTAVVSMDDLEKRYHMPHAQAAALCNRWVREGVLRQVGVRTYNFAPGKNLRAHIEDFVKRWKHPRDHAQMMQKVMENEARSGS